MPSASPALQPIPFSDVVAIVKKVWGYDTFRGGQAETIKPILEGRDALAVLPTGGGKSLIFQSLALALPGQTLVISPLIALMLDQVKNARAMGISVACVSTMQDEEEVALLLRTFAAGNIKILYVAPERLNTPYFRALCQRVKLSLIAVDECHCVSRLIDHRPAYGLLGEFIDAQRKKTQHLRVLAVTATATLEVEEDIRVGCRLEPGHARIWKSPVRQEINLEVPWVGEGGGWSLLKSYAKQFDLAGGRHLIYVGSRKGAEMVAMILVRDANIPPALVAFYHAGMEKPQRAQVQDDFTKGTIRVVVATCAFGMGIDIPDIRTVLHFGIPGAMEDYAQEIGRAARDGKKSRAILLCSGESDYSVDMRRMLIDLNHPPYETYAAVWAFLHSRLAPGEVLALSGENMAVQMVEDGLLAAPAGSDVGRVYGGAILQVLSNLERHGLVTRQSREAWTEVTPLLELNTVEASTPVMGKVLDWLCKQEGSSYQFDRGEVALALKIGDAPFLMALTALHKQKIIALGKTFRGKSTRIVRHGEALDSLLVQSDIEKARMAALERLNKMLDYLKAPQRFGLPGDAGHRAYIEAYFNGGLI
jgi:RecQ family ATP-dependent DNA helicase